MNHLSGVERFANQYRVMRHGQSKANEGLISPGGSVGHAMNHLSCIDRLANRYWIMRHGQSKANEAGIIVSRIETDRSGDWGLSELGQRQAAEAARACGLPADTVICSSDFSRARQTAEIVRSHLGAAAVIIAEALRERCFGDLEGSAVENYARVWAADEAHRGHVDIAQADSGQADNGHPASGHEDSGHPASDHADSNHADSGHPASGHPASGHPASDHAGSNHADSGHADSGHPASGVELAAAVLDRVTALIARLERRYSERDILLVSHGDTLQILQAGFLRLAPCAHRRLPHLATAEIRELRLHPEPSQPND